MNFKQLDPFQKQAIDEINRENNILVTAPTSSGKTYCAYHAISVFIHKYPKKHVIYTSPIKSLSNQKFQEFNSVFKNQVGLITGDIKYNMTAPLLIMTTEVLRNLMYNHEIPTYDKQSSVSINPDKSISCIIFDEMHYLFDKQRGNVWEEVLIFSPPHIQLTMLSATVQNPQRICTHLTKIKKRDCILIEKKERVVKLKYFVYHYYPYIDAIKDDTTRKHVEKYSNKLIQLKNYPEVKKVNSLTTKKVSEVGSVKAVAFYLKVSNRLPGLFFCFSRNKCEHYASKLGLRLTKVAEQKEIEKFVRLKVGQCEELKKLHFETPEYMKYLDLWKDGIGYHHSGMKMIYRELLEMLYSKGMVKLIFATETFAVGINAPVRTVVFTQMHKFSGTNFRELKWDEVKQMSGRAGRRGIDKVGNVVILNNFVRDHTDVQSLVKKQTTVMKPFFRIRFQSILGMHQKKINSSAFVNNLIPCLMSGSLSQKLRLQDMEMYLIMHHFLDEKLKVTPKGRAASCLNQVNSILLTEVLNSGILNKLSAAEAVSVFSLFIEGPIKYDAYYAAALPLNIQEAIIKIVELKERLESDDVYRFNTENKLDFNMINLVHTWCTESPVHLERWLYTGDFSKYILRLDNLICNISSINWVKIPKLPEMHSILIRDVVNCKSLYLL